MCVVESVDDGLLRVDVGGAHREDQGSNSLIVEKEYGG